MAMGWHRPSPREEFCFHLSEAVDLLARASRQLRLASAFAPDAKTRAALDANRRRTDAIACHKGRLFRRFCLWC